MRRRRTALSTAGVAVLTAGVVLASQTLAGPAQSEPPVAQMPVNVVSPSVVPPSPTPSGVPTTAGTRPNMHDLPTLPLAAPWSDKQYTKLPEANAYRPHGYYVKRETKLDNRPWGMVSHQPTESNRDGGCLTVTPQGVFDAAACFHGTHASGVNTDWRAQTATRGTKPALQKLNYTLVYGAAHFDARTVKVTLVGGASYVTDAVGTPTSRSQRFFAVVVPVKDAKIAKVAALDAKGNLAPELLD